jgi:hypothetical protein
MLWHPSALTATLLAFMTAQYGKFPMGPPQPVKEIEFKALPGIKWQVESLFGFGKEFSAELLSAEAGIVKWRLVANRKVGPGDLLGIAEARQFNDPHWREMGSYLASFCDDKGVAFTIVPIFLVDGEGKEITQTIGRGDAVYGMLKLPAQRDKIKLVKLR